MDQFDTYCVSAEIETDVDRLRFLMHKLLTEYAQILRAQPPDVLVDFNQIRRLLIKRIAPSPHMTRELHN